jgi:class 3 adenylate cyclase
MAAKIGTMNSETGQAFLLTSFCNHHIMPEQTRQLAAIMFTDIVGYTALMGNDEQKAFDLLNKNRQIQKPIIEQYGGRWIKELGDGVMASFNTVSDAITAAIKIQQVCHSSNDFQLRIGIHLGEIVFEQGDVFGDGVNIASRIQAIANPGGIFISESVYNSISNKKEFQAKFLKEVKLKNVNKPVKIYQVIADGVTIAPAQIGQRIKPTGKILSVSLIIAGLLIAGFFL